MNLAARWLRQRRMWAVRLARRTRTDADGDVRVRVRSHPAFAGANPLARGRRPSDTVPAMEELLLAWYGQNRRDLPWRETHDPYAILVSEVMLQQTQVSRVVPRYLEWLER